MLRLPISSRPHIASPFFSLLLLLGSLPIANGVLVNRTIDDEYGDSVTGVKPVYSPTGSDPRRDEWKQGLSCVTPCVFHPYTVIDVTQASNGTWHDSTYRAEYGEAHTVTAAFEGTAVYVYFIVPNRNVLTATLVNLTVTIDGTFRGQYMHVPDSSDTIMYHVLVFHTTDLASAVHTIQVSASGTNDSLLLFDNMIYTAEDADPTQNQSQSMSSSTGTTTVTSGSVASPTSSARSPVAAIAGGVAGGVAALVLLLVVLLCFCSPCRSPASASRTDRVHPKRWMSRLPRRRRHRYASPPALDIDESPWAPTAVDPYPVIHPGSTVCSPIIPGGQTEGAEDLEKAAAQARDDSSATLPQRRDTPPSANRATSSSRAGVPVSAQAGSVLRNQMAVLQEEVARLRNAEAEMRRLFLDSGAPPRYDDEES